MCGGGATHRLVAGWVVVLATGLGCGKGPTPLDDAPALHDARLVDAAPADARASEGREVVSGGGRVSGGGYTVDVQLGHPVEQAPTAGGGHTTEGGAVIKP